MHHRRAGALEAQRADIVGDQGIAALRERRGERRFAGARGAAEQHRPTIDPHRAGVEHDLLALVQEDAKHGAEDEDRDVGLARRRLRLNHDGVAAGKKKPGDVRNPHQELASRDLPRRPGGAGVRQFLRHLAAADRHLRRA